MPTLWSETLIPTLRAAPADAEVPSHRLMLRAGLIRKLGSGSYTYLPLGVRALAKVQQIIREEMAAAGAAEVFMPTLQPVDLWERTGRRAAYGENLFVVEDRHGREQALGPTHEEVVTELVGGYVESYKDLPLTVYQIQTKFRDEFRPRFGVLRSREFLMKDAYSFHLAVEGEGGLSATYDKQYAAYERIFTRCGLRYLVVEAEAGPIGGSASHEFMVPTPTGEDTILRNDAGTYAANVEKAETGDRAWSFDGEPTGELEEVHTPGCPGIDDVCRFMKVKPRHMLKTLVLRADDRWVVAVVRGDHEVNEAKLRSAAGAKSLEMADDAEARAAGFPVGFLGPHVPVSCVTYVDPDAAQEQFWATGGNEADHHVKHFNWRRDLLDHVEEGCVKVADIRNAVEGDPAPEDRGGGTLHATKGIEVGHVFKLGDKYTRGLNVTVTNESNEAVHPLMGCYGIGVNRILASAIEQDGGHDDAGIIWPASIAPYTVLITPIKYAESDEVRRVTDELAAVLEGRSPGTPVPGLETIDILIDDRDERPGVKFNDADLIGIPLRVTVGDKGLSQDPPAVEIKARDGRLGGRGESVPVAQAADRIREVLAEMRG